MLLINSSVDPPPDTPGVLEKFECDLASNTKVTKQEVLVVKGLNHNILGLPAITALNLAARVNCTASTNSMATEFKSDFYR